MKNYTDLTLVIDRSGSMSSIAKDMEGGFATFLENEKKTGDDTKVTAIYFDDKYQIDFVAKNIKDVDGIKIVPRGSTALMDALGKAITETGERLAALDEADRPNRVLFYVITDGYENASQEYTREQVKTKIEHQRSKYAWDFVFLGTTDIDTATESLSLGITAASTAGFNRSAKGVAAMWAANVQDFANYKKLDRSLDTNSTYCAMVAQAAADSDENK